jgi:hypothetical protein
MPLLNQYKCIAGNMKSFFRGLIERVSSSVKAHTAVAAAAPPVLGRWGIQYDERIIDRKIVQANEDHCGCCVVAENPKKKKTMVQYEQTEEYLVPYVM